MNKQTILTISCLVTIIALSPKTLPHLRTKTIQKITDKKVSQKLKITPKTSLSKLVVSVKNFGAKGDGIADDTNAIQKAIDTVYKAGGGTVFFPKGSYKIKIDPSRSSAIIIRAKVKLQGDENRETTIKLAERQGDYDAIFAGEKLNSDLSDFGMYNLVIDGNSSNNPIGAASVSNDKLVQMRYTLKIFFGSIINIERCIFTNQNNANTISINGQVSDISIKNNIFKMIGGGQVDYDHSTIYTHGKGIEIINNYFASKNGAGTKVARTAIEIHGDKHVVKNNIITGFTNGIFVTGYAKSSDHQIITNNVIEEAHSGIVIWSFFSHGNTTRPAISNCYIANNKISLNIDGWRSLWGNAPGVGIGLEPGSDSPVENLSIVNNQIYFQKLLSKGRRRDNTASGIRLWRDDHPHVISENIRIVHNQINNPLASGIYISMPVNNIEILKNEILNPGQSNGSFPDDYRAGIIIAGNLKNIKLKGNLIFDNQSVSTMKAGIVIFNRCTQNCQIEKNKLYVNNSNRKKLEVYRFKSKRNSIFQGS